MSGPEPPTDEVEEHRMPLMDHLRELRYRLVVSGLALAGGMVIGMPLANPVFALLTAPMRMIFEDAHSYPRIDAFYLTVTEPIRNLLPASLTEVTIEGTLALTTSPMEGVYTWLRVALLTGALLASPIIAYQGWNFVAPGLYHTEKRVVMPLALTSSFLFALGAAFAFLVLLPVAFPFFLQVVKATPILSIDGYLRAVARMLIAFGICFQLPVVVWFLSRIGLIDHRDMVRGFRYAIVGLFAVAAIITPPDILTQIILGIPLVSLYGLSIGVAWWSTTKVRDDEG
jgi:sec-independent protein translocase protein TatC